MVDLCVGAVLLAVVGAGLVLLRHEWRLEGIGRRLDEIDQEGGDSDR